MDGPKKSPLGGGQAGHSLLGESREEVASSAEYDTTSSWTPVNDFSHKLTPPVCAETERGARPANIEIRFPLDFYQDAERADDVCKHRDKKRERAVNVIPNQCKDRQQQRYNNCRLTRCMKADRLRVPVAIKSGDGVRNRHRNARTRVVHHAIDTLGSGDLYLDAIQGKSVLAAVKDFNNNGYSERAFNHRTHFLCEFLVEEGTYLLSRRSAQNNKGGHRQWREHRNTDIWLSEYVILLGKLIPSSPLIGNN